MDNKKFFVIVAIIVALLLVGLFYVIFIHDFERIDRTGRDTSKPSRQSLDQDSDVDRMPADDEKEGEEGSGGQTVRHTGEDKDTTDPYSEDNFTETSLKNMASSFAERFGSYSNHSNYGNFDDLEVFMTEDMQEWAEGVVQKERDKETTNEYRGVTTKAIVSDVKEFDKEEGTAEVVVSTKRRESASDKSDSKTFNQKLTLEFVNQDGVWKVDGAFWEE